MNGGLPLPRRLLAIFSLFVGSMLLTMDASMPGIALPIIARDLGEAPSTTVLLISIYNLILAMTLLPFATLGDRIGQRRLFSLGLLVYTLAAAGCYAANSFTLLLVLRALQAVGAAAALSVSIALLKSVYPSTHLGRGLGLNTVAAASGAAMAPALGGLILSLGSWHWVFAAGIPLAIASLVSGRALPDSERRKDPFDFYGAALCAATFGLVIAGLQGATQGLNVFVSTTILLSGAIAAVLLVRGQLKHPRPILPVDLLARPVLALSMMAAFTAVLGSTILLLSMPFRLHAYGFNPAEIGAVIAPYAVATVICSPASGMLADRIHAGVLGTIGLVVAFIAVICLVFIPVHPSHYDVAWRMSLCGAGFGMFFSPNARLIIASAPAERAAAASSLVATARMMGQALAATALGALLSMHLGAGEGPVLVAAALTTVAGLCSAARLRPSLFHH